MISFGYNINNNRLIYNLEKNKKFFAIYYFILNNSFFFKMRIS